MTFGATGNSGISRQRGSWLRCFLGPAFFAMALCMVAPGRSWAKIEPPGPLHLWRLHGFFMNTAGKPIENVEVTLLRDGETRYRTRTDASGRFAFDHVYGHYSVHIEKSKDYSQLSREIIVGEVATMLHGNTLYVIAGPGACMDDCSSVFTSKSDFEKAVRKNSVYSQRE